MYVPFGQDAFGTMWILASIDGDPTSLTSLARQALREIDPALPAYSIAPLATAVSDSVARRRFSMLLLAAFAGIALFLAAVGIYGVVAYSVSQRTQEIGIRMALGASARDVQGRIVMQTLSLAAVGMVLGTIVSWLAVRSADSLLFGVTPRDPATFGGMLVVLTAMLSYGAGMRQKR